VKQLQRLLRKRKTKKNKKNKKRSKSKEDVDTLEKALEAEQKHHEKVSELLSMNERKRPYNSMFDVKQPTENEVEAYLMKRRREDDPMLQFIDK